MRAQRDSLHNEDKKSWRSGHVADHAPGHGLAVAAVAGVAVVALDHVLDDSLEELGRSQLAGVPHVAGFTRRNGASLLGGRQGGEAGLRTAAPRLRGVSPGQEGEFAAEIAANWLM